MILKTISCYFYNYFIVFLINTVYNRKYILYLGGFYEKNWKDNRYGSDSANTCR